MTIRRQTILTVIAIFVALGGLMFYYSRVIVLESFEALETANIQRLSDRMTNWVSSHQERLVGTAHDWSQWDHTYEFILSGDQSFVRSNFTDEFFQALRIHIMLFVDVDGHLIYGHAVDKGYTQVTPVPEDLAKFASADTALSRLADAKAWASGLLKLDSGAMFLASTPITRTDDSGEIRGVVIVGRYVDLPLMRQRVTDNNAELSLHWIDESLPPDVREALSTESGWLPTGTQESEDTAVAYALVTDVERQPIAAFRAETPRRIYAQGMAAVHYFALWLAAGAVLLGLAMLLLLERNVLSRISSLGKQLNTIRAESDLSQRLAVTGNDELSSLADDVNSLLERIAKSLDREIVKANNQHQLRVAQELHDNLGQILTGISLTVESLRSASDVDTLERRRQLSKVLELLKEAIRQTRNIAVGMAPVQIELGGLAYVLEELARDSSDQLGLACRLSCGGMTDGLDRDTATHLYHIAKESISNAARHGGAKNISIGLRREEEHLVLSVHDDGTGIRGPSGEGPGLGLRLMRLRADMIDGQLTVRSNGEDGTSVECRIPGPPIMTQIEPRAAG